MYTNRLPFHADVSVKQYSFLSKLMCSGNAVLSDLFSMFGEHQWKLLCVKYCDAFYCYFLVYVYDFTVRFLSAIRSYSEGRGICFTVCLFVCSRQKKTSGPIHAKVRMQAYSGSGCVFSPFGGWRPPAGGKRGKWNFRYYKSQRGIFAFWRFLSHISATRARIHTKYYLCTDNVCRHAPSPCGIHRPLGGGGRGS